MPRIGEGFDFVLPENMVCSMHPHFMNQERTHSLYFQETYRVGRDGGEPLSGVPIKAYQGGEEIFLVRRKFRTAEIQDNHKLRLIYGCP